MIYLVQTQTGANMKRDIIVSPLNKTQKLIISTDCSGSCGELQLDTIKVSYELMAYYTARVPFMEVMSVKATPVAYTVSNFIKTGYDAIHLGINKVLNELNLSHLPNITSTETNFKMVQSAMGISVIGTMEGKINDNASNLSFACIGSPLVGDEVIGNSNKMIKLSTFTELVNDKKAIKLLPTGSKGIGYKLKKVFNIDALSSDVDLNKSAGPSTCILLGYNKEDENYFRNKLKEQFHSITI